ncbi:SEC-C domain-containing protein [Patescibacteria group bacterium]|nr:SEC-C domain-containing protein [Patescibacteria group bacterium]
MHQTPQNVNPMLKTIRVIPMLIPCPCGSGKKFKKCCGR